MEELSGQLIQMNAHMEVSSKAILLGILTVALVLIAVASWWEVFDRILKKKERQKSIRAPLLLAIIFTIGAFGCGMATIQTPRDKIIHAYAAGPITLSSIETRYDILSVNGTELTLRVRK